MYDEVPSINSERLLMRFSFGLFPFATFCLVGIEDVPCIACFRAANFRDPRIIVMGAGRLAIVIIPTLKPQTSDDPAMTSNTILDRDNLDFIALFETLANLRFESDVSIPDVGLQRTNGGIPRFQNT